MVARMRRSHAVIDRRAAVTRRDLIALGGAALAWPLAARAQPQSDGGTRHLGVLMGLHVNNPEGLANAAALKQALAELAWHEDANLQIDWRWAGSDPALFQRYAAELVALNPEVLLAQGSSAVAALRQQTSDIPIVFVSVADPIDQGFVKSLAHPGGNITGFSNYDPPMVGKWLEMLAQLTPAISRVSVLYNPATTRYAGLMLRAIEAAASSFALSIRAATVRNDAEIETTIASLAREAHSGLLMLPSAFFTDRSTALVALAARYRLPAVYAWRFFVTAGGLMCYGVSREDLYRRSASYIDRILKGEKPADLPVQAPTKFELVINLKTAKTLGLAVAPSLLATADEVIE